jgi:Pectate lyase
LGRRLEVKTYNKRGSVKTLTLVGFLLCAAPAFAQVEGFGASATGGAGGSVCTVNNTLATGPGSFSDCARRGNVVVQFNSPGPYTVDGQQTYLKSNTTIDGCLNGQNGVTLNQPGDIYRGVILEGQSNLIVRCIRFQGERFAGMNEHDLLALDGTNAPVRNVLVDRCTFNQAEDGALDIVGDVADVTVSHNLFYDNQIASLVKYGGTNNAQGGNAPQRISFHHNVYTQDGERNPQLRGPVFADLVSEIVGPGKRITVPGVGTYSVFGTLLWNSTTAGEGPVGNVHANITDSIFLGTFDGPAIDIRNDPGASPAGIFLSGNQCEGGCPNSPASQPNPIPTPAAVAVTPVAGLAATLPAVGAPNRTAADQAAVDGVALLLGGPTPAPTPVPTPTPTPVPTPTPTPKPTPTPSPTPTPTPAPTPTPCPGPTPCPAPILSTSCGTSIADSKLATGKKLRRVVTTCDTTY